MTEQEWLTSEDPAAMLAHFSVTSTVAHHKMPSSRKLRLFACACCRQVWNTITDEISKKAVEAGELYADKLITKEEQNDIYSEVIKADLKTTVNRAASVCIRPREIVKLPQGISLPELSSATQANLLRDVVGNPFRPVALPYPGDLGTVHYRPGDPVKLDVDAICPWLTPTVLSLAQVAYQDRPGRECGRCEGVGCDPYRDSRVEKAPCPDCHGTGRVEDGSLDPHALAVLSDALEEAGAADEILTHLRSSDTHVRGCWALDLILGKE